MSSATAADNREVRHFELEADRRARRMFVLIVVAFALLAIGGGIFAAYLLLWDDDETTIAPPRPKPPAPVEEFEPVPGVAWTKDEPDTRPTRSSGPRLAETVSDGELARGLARLQAAFDECARTHGAIDGMTVNIDFSVGESGRVVESDARPPFGKTPLGQCVAGVVRSKGSFARTRTGRRDVRWTVKLRRQQG